MDQTLLESETRGGIKQAILVAGWIIQDKNHYKLVEKAPVGHIIIGNNTPHASQRCAPWGVTCFWGTNQPMSKPIASHSAGNLLVVDK